MSVEVTIPENMPRRGSPWLQGLGRLFLRLRGWKLVGELPNERKVVVVLAPHTSNWDFVIAASVWLALDLKLSYLMKQEAFFWPMKGFFMDIGGIPIDRSRPQSIIRGAVKWFREHDGVWLGITPEGTRKKVDKWKTGFLRIAHEARVPILLVGIDGTTQTIVIDKVLEATGDHTTQAAELREYMNHKFSGVNPQYHL
ncbi:MAG: acyltransferase [Gammaproteobacteria bacterium]|nr:acyltransferase [Gammaproteobacteria bacterium]